MAFNDVTFPHPRDGDYAGPCETNDGYIRLWPERDGKNAADVGTIAVERVNADDTRDDIEPLAAEIARRWNAHQPNMDAIDGALVAIHGMHNIDRMSTYDRDRLRAAVAFLEMARHNASARGAP